MNPSLAAITIHRTAIGWFVILAFVSLTLFPQHYHLHHTDESAVYGSVIHEHPVAGHGHAGTEDLDHHADVHVIESMADASVKSQGFQSSSDLLLLVVLFLLPLLLHQLRLEPGSYTRPPPHFTRHRHPPLRAPPRG